jgi:predicted negative regulator of RcsB-dependent stress response
MGQTNPGFGGFAGTNKNIVRRFFSKRIVYLFIVLIVLALGILTYRYFSTSEERELAKRGVSSPEQFEKSGVQSTNSFLKYKDYTSYTNSQVLLASHYEAMKDYISAERVMNEVFSSVPADKTSSIAYSEMANIEQGLGKTDEYKKYLTLLAKKYDSEGNSKSATSIRQLVDSIK